MALENNLVVDSDAELKAFLSSILSSEGIVVNINRTFIAYNNGTNRNRVFARCANRMAQKGTDEKFVVIALMCYPALNWILKARDIDAMIEQLHDMDTDGSVRNISEIQSLLENSTGYVILLCVLRSEPAQCSTSQQCGSQNEKRTGKARGGKNESI